MIDGTRASRRGSRARLGVGAGLLFACFSPVFGEGNRRDVGVGDSPGSPADPVSRTVPLVMNGDHILIEVTIHGRTLHLTLDNGNVTAPTILYGSPKIDAIGLRYEGTAFVGGAGDGPMADARIASSVTLGLAGTQIPDQTIIVMRHDPALLKAFEGEDGVIGGAVWERFVVGVDFDRGVVVFTDTGASLDAPPGQEFRLGTLPDGGSTLRGSLTLLDGKEVPALFHLDLGSPVALSVNSGRHATITRPEKTIERTGYGSQGEFTEHIGRVQALRLGDFVLEDVLTSFTETPSLARMGNEGALGSGVLQRFNFTLDYSNRRLFLEPNRRFQDPFPFDMSGLGLRRTDEGHFYVARVRRNSPASEAGVQAGDVLVAIDGRASASIGRDEVKRMLMEEGRTRTLTVDGRGGPKTVSILLRRLI